MILERNYCPFRWSFRWIVNDISLESHRFFFPNWIIIITTVVEFDRLLIYLIVIVRKKNIKCDSFLLAPKLLNNHLIVCFGVCVCLCYNLSLKYSPRTIHSNGSNLTRFFFVAVIPIDSNRAMREWKLENEIEKKLIVFFSLIEIDPKQTQISHCSKSKSDFFHHIVFLPNIFCSVFSHQERLWVLLSSLLAV